MFRAQGQTQCLDVGGIQPTIAPRFELVPLIETFKDSSSISKRPLPCDLRLFSDRKYMQNNGLSQSLALGKLTKNH
jgi:hypothetical protein